jgi:hypothetical protein
LSYLNGVQINGIVIIFSKMLCTKLAGSQSHI